MLRNDDRLGQELRRAYEVPALSEAGREGIRRGIRTAPPVRRKPYGRLAIAAGLAAAVLAVATPIARANYLGYSIAARLRDVRPVTVTISMAAGHLGPGERVRSRPMVASVADGVCILSEAGPETDTVYRFEPNRMIQFSPRDGKSVVRPVDSNWVELLALPDRIASQLESFRLDKKIRSRGKAQVNGRLVDEVELDAEGIARKVILDLDPKSGRPLRMRLRWNLAMPETIFDYDWDAAKARRTVAQSENALQSAPQVDLAESRRALSQSANAHSLRQVELGRDRLTIYRIEQNRRGDIFVLYACRGYHGAEDRKGNWLRLEDGRHRQWLSDIVDLSFSKLRLRGEYAKAQVFFAPSGDPSVDRIRLYAQMREWEFVSPTESQAGTRRRELGTFRPSSVPIGQPDWVYEAFNFNDPNWLAANASKLRFEDALRRGDFARAKKEGTGLESRFPDLMSGFFYDRARLSLGLYHSFRGTGDRVTARRYLQDAVRRRNETVDRDFQRDLAASLVREGLPAPGGLPR